MRTWLRTWLIQTEKILNSLCGKLTHWMIMLDILAGWNPPQRSQSSEQLWAPGSEAKHLTSWIMLVTSCLIKVAWASSRGSWIKMMWWAPRTKSICRWWLTSAKSWRMRSPKGGKQMPAQPPGLHPMSGPWSCWSWCSLSWTAPLHYAMTNAGESWLKLILYFSPNLEGLPHSLSPCRILEP